MKIYLASGYMPGGPKTVLKLTKVLKKKIKNNKMFSFAYINQGIQFDSMKVYMRKEN